MICKPLLIEFVNGRRLRIFRNPNGRPELPWHATSDLLGVLNYPIALRSALLRELQAGWGRRLANIATSEGPLVIAPHPIAVELFTAAIECGLICEEVRSEYEHAGARALLAQTAELPIGLCHQLSGAAYRNTWAGQ
ncbi:hypothetical protein [Methylocapsa palsarum]|uniref:Uncharacterized protein n=1 Tax=Methylocapsa palsarum TaxID=1612308 RepID=A0A1I4CD56_9HYPH|nr:hypothetical protein [Methylocapsa palsarum]SFK79112.1 hypothetical protein SAMN05444581_12117 [Methylocapsa palsarum]